MEATALADTETLREVETRSIEILKGQDLWKAQAILALEESRKIKINTVNDYRAAGALREQLTARAKQLDGLLNPGCEAAHALHKKLVADRKACVDPYNDGAKIIKQAMIRFDDEQERLRRLEQARLEADAKKKADDEALELAALLEEAGQGRAAAEVLEAPIAPAPVAVPKSTPKIDGFSSRTIWKAESLSIPAMLQGWKDGKIPAEAFQADIAFLRHEASRLQEAAIGRWPGVKVWSEKV